MPRIMIVSCAAAPLLLLSAPLFAQASGPRPVSRAEFVKTIDARFAGADSNHDGKMSKAEVVAAQQRDLQLQRQALRQQVAAQFKQLDTNKDGQLSQAEFIAGVPEIRSAATPEQVIGKLDTNRDGSISAEEFRAPELAGFLKADANRDGIVTPAEMNAANRRK